VVYGCADPKAGALGSVVAIGTGAGFNHRFEAVGGVLSDACALRLQLFFGLLRAAGEK
jgi:tRNA(adenine34) deaminase